MEALSIAGWTLWLLPRPTDKPKPCSQPVVTIAAVSFQVSDWTDVVEPICRRRWRLIWRGNSLPNVAVLNVMWRIMRRVIKLDPV